MGRKGGRQRVSGERTESGQLSRSAAAVAERSSVEQRAQRMAQRYQMLGDTGQGVDITDPIAVLEALKHINAEEASAGAEIARLHNELFGKPWPKVPGATTAGPTMSNDDQDKREAALRARYERAWEIIGTVGGNARVIVRYVCCGREMPAWVTTKPMVSIRRGRLALVGKDDKDDLSLEQFKAVSNLDRAALRAMSRELPALQVALRRCYDAGIVSTRKGRR